MNALKLVATIYLLITGGLVALHRVTVAAYPDSWESAPGEILHWLMAAGLLVLFLLSAYEHFSGGKRIEQDLAFYGTIALGVTFFWVWGCSTWSDTQVAHTAHAVWWPAVDAAYVVAAFAVSRRLYQN